MEVENRISLAESFLGLLVVDHDEGNLDDEDLVVLTLTTEFGDARGFLCLPQEIPARPNLFALADAEFLDRFRFTQRQIVAIHNALDMPPRELLFAL